MNIKYKKNSETLLLTLNKEKIFRKKYLCVCVCVCMCMCVGAEGVAGVGAAGEGLPKKLVSLSKK